MPETCRSPPLFRCIYLALMIVAGVVCLPIMSTRTRDGSIIIDSGDVAVGVARLFRGHVRLARCRRCCLYTYSDLARLSGTVDIPYTHVVPTPNYHVLAGR